MIQNYCIAGHTIQLEGEKLVSLAKAIDGFDAFRTNSEVCPLITITSKDTDTMLAPTFQEREYDFLFEGIQSIFGTTANGYLFQMSLEFGETLSLWGNPDEQVLYLKGNLEISALSLRLVRFALWIAFGMCTTRLNTIAIHTSTIEYQGKAVLFLGESGTGKSTHTRLWRENIEGANLLNDDSPILRIIDGEPWIYGSPWSGKTPCYRNERFPLGACVRLSQAPCNRIRKLKTFQAYAAIHPSCPPEFAYDETLYDGISMTLDQLLRKVSFYHLECLPNAEAALLSRNTVFSKDKL